MATFLASPDDKEGAKRFDRCSILNRESISLTFCFLFFFQAEDGIRDSPVTGVQTCALPICAAPPDERNCIEEPEALSHGAPDPCSSNKTASLADQSRHLARRIPARARYLAVSQGKDRKSVV